MKKRLLLAAFCALLAMPATCGAEGYSDWWMSSFVPQVKFIATTNRFANGRFGLKTETVAVTAKRPVDNNNLSLEIIDNGDGTGSIDLWLTVADHDVYLYIDGNVMVSEGGTLFTGQLLGSGYFSPTATNLEEYFDFEALTDVKAVVKRGPDGEILEGVITLNFTPAWTDFISDAEYPASVKPFTVTATIAPWY